MKQRITRLAAALALGTLAATGYTLTTQTAATQQDTGWGAPDTTDTTWTPTNDGDGADADADAGTDVDTTQGDSGWG